MKSTFEEVLTKDGYLVYTTRGRSMEPLLRQNRDLVILCTRHLASIQSTRSVLDMENVRILFCRSMNVISIRTATIKGMQEVEMSRGSLRE